MQKKKDKICKLHESIETLSLSHTLSRSKLDLSNFVSTNAATRFRAASISDIEQPIAFQRTVSSVPEIVVHLDNYSSLPIPPPPSSSPSQDQSPKRVRQPSFRNFDSKNSFDRSWLKDISRVPFDPVRPTLSFDRCESPSSLASKNGKVFRREREKRKKKTLSAFKNRMANKPQPRRN